MGQWTNVDEANGAPSWIPAYVRLRANTSNRNAIYANTTSFGVFGVDVTEAQANKQFAHAGWVKRVVGTGGRAGRVQTEVLVAMGSISGDGDVNAIANVFIRVYTSPVPVTAATNTATSFSVNAIAVPSGVLTYRWEANTGTGYANLAANAVYTNVSSGSLLIANTTGLTGTTYRAVITSTGGANTVTTAGVSLTVV